LQQVVTPILERQKAGGAIAEKFEVAYLRSFAFSDPPRAEAEKIYARWAGHANPDLQEYERLQSFIFRYVAMECGRLEMPVHLHTFGGLGRYFSISGVNPLLLEPLFNDPRLRNTNFVLLHGGWPFVHEIGALLQKPNVYLDLSLQSLAMTPPTQSQWLREWLEWEPEKVLFGTDAYPLSDEMGWPESAWIASRNEREALGIALTGMLQDGEITRKRASELIRMVLHGNAETLYRLPAMKSQGECVDPLCSSSFLK
jgi:predicted TIM-barrel fold metal-dependent hydrolase